MSNSKKPYRKIAVPPVAAAIWRNEHNGETLYSVTFERRYKDDAGNWKSSASFNTSELVLLSKVADMAFTAICEAHNCDLHGTQPEE